MPRSLLMVPGPVELADDVTLAHAQPALSHVGPEFRDLAGRVLGKIRTLFDAPAAQPVVVPGSGTLGMEIALANLLEPGDRVLILETGVFARRFEEVARRAGAEIRVERAPVGKTIDPDAVTGALDAFRPKVMTITHVDTSTGVRADVPTLAAVARARDALVVVDGVCAIGGEEYHGDAWGVDVSLTASQKAIAAPPGVAILTIGPRARAVREARRAPFPGYFTDLVNWFPVMEGYEQAAPRYFGTPPVTLFPALDAALSAVLEEGLAARVARHARNAAAFRAGLAAIGLPNLVTVPAHAANTLSVPTYPTNVGDGLVELIREEGVTVAKAIHPELAGTCFRVGHMGTCTAAEVLITLGAIERALRRSGAPVALGAGLAAAQEKLVERR